MNPSRRTALKQFLIVAGGVALLPSCMQQDGSATSIPLKHLKLTGADEKTLAELAETILPATNTPGAKDLYLQQFILKMTDDCQSPEEQQAFEKGLKAFNRFSEKEYDTPFASLSADKRTALLQRIETGKDIPEDVAGFYNGVKGLSIQGYLGSKYYLTKVQVYELVPGRFRGCVPVSTKDSTTGARPA